MLLFWLLGPYAADAAINLCNCVYLCLLWPYTTSPARGVFSKTRSTSIRGIAWVSTTKFNESYDSDESTYNVIRTTHIKSLVLWNVYERLDESYQESDCSSLKNIDHRSSTWILSIKTLAPPWPPNPTGKNFLQMGTFQVHSLSLSEYFNMYFTKFKVTETDIVSVLEPFWYYISKLLRLPKYPTSKRTKE